MKTIQRKTTTVQKTDNIENGFFSCLNREYHLFNSQMETNNEPEWQTVVSKSNLKKLKKSKVVYEKCTFCGRCESICGGDHGDEMRDIMRERTSRYY